MGIPRLNAFQFRNYFVLRRVSRIVIDNNIDTGVTGVKSLRRYVTRLRPDVLTIPRYFLEK